MHGNKVDINSNWFYINPAKLLIYFICSRNKNHLFQQFLIPGSRWEDKERNSYSKKEKKEKQNFWKSMKINFGTTSEYYCACKHKMKCKVYFTIKTSIYLGILRDTSENSFFCHPSSWWLTITIVETEIIKLELIIKFPYSKFLISFRNINIIVQFYQSPVKNQIDIFLVTLWL